MKNRLSFLLLLIYFVISSSCKHELETPSWDVDIITPIVTTQVTIDQINIKDSLLEIQSNDSGLVSLVFENNLSDINFDSLINIDTEVPGKTERLDSINFPTINISDTITLGDLISTIPLGTILFPNGGTASIPAIPNAINSDTFNINASEYFETMTLIDGVLIFEIKNISAALNDLEPEDLLNYGLIPEFVGRLPIVTTLEDLDEESLIKILQEPKNALVKQYQTLFNMENVKLILSNDALKVIAKKAIERKTGARGLRSILENILLDTMFELPSLDGVEEVVINAEAAEGSVRPLYIYSDNKKTSETSA